MPREAEPRLDRRSRRWIVQMGEPSPATGRRARVILRDEQGRPIKDDDKAGAYAAYARMLAERRAEEERQRGPTACDVVAAYIRWHQANGSMDDTITTHVWHLDHFLDFEHGGEKYNDRSAASFEVADWTRYRKSMQANGLATGSIRLAFSSVHACWRWASRPIEDREPMRLIPENPFQGLIRPKKGKGRRLVLPLPSVLRLAEFATEWAERPIPEEAPRNQKVAIIRERPFNRLKALACRLIIETGCRPKEAAMLRWDWVHEGERVIEIPEEVIKTHQDRFIALRPVMAEALAQLRASGRTHPVWVFLVAGDPRSEPLDAHRLAETFARIRKAAREQGIDLPKGTSLYTFRHSLVTLAHAAGMDLREIAPAFGHSAETAEKTYAHLKSGHVVKVMDEAWERIEKGKEGGGRGSDP